jgi:hypothetical protein
MKRLLLFVISWLVMASGAANAAVYFVLVPDMSQLQWQMDSGGIVWLRNLNAFDGAVLGCCYNFSIDTTTAAGKSIWSSMLAKIELAQPLWLGLNNGNATPGSVVYIGNW